MSRRCSGCGRPLRDPVSRAAGMGPVCRRAVQQATHLALPTPATASPRRRRPRGPITTLPDIATYQSQEATR
ncbi:DUF6011 domain-containing protein [Streptomyces sp. NPDC053499]|uniref:DUF6011 domain-containing protein n=1 Tax=Streptomyces sp. NPDC053499 TaxID=3365707 RepID=UPI0037D29917